MRWSPAPAPSLSRPPPLFSPTPARASAPPAPGAWAPPPPPRRAPPRRAGGPLGPPPPAGVAILLVLLALAAGHATMWQAAEESVSVRDTAVLTTVFWLALAMLLVYHVVWV